jgi:hypothetical protein
MIAIKFFVGICLNYDFTDCLMDYDSCFSYRCNVIVFIKSKKSQFKQFLTGSP